MAAHRLVLEALAVELEDWQQQLVAQHPELFLRGLFNSDSCGTS
ncbi:hypothetical protein [Kribbella sp. NPDC048928]